MKTMNEKLALIIVLALGFVLAISCASSPKSPTQPPAEQPPTRPPTEQPPTTPPPTTPPGGGGTGTTTTTYNRHPTDIILDGAIKYVIKRGDTLAFIAWDLYNDGFYYPLIFMVSRDVVSDPDWIYPGDELTVPNLSTNLSDARALASIKRFLLEIASNIEDQRNRHRTAEGMRQRAN